MVPELKLSVSALALVPRIVIVGVPAPAASKMTSLVASGMPAGFQLPLPFQLPPSAAAPVQIFWAKAGWASAKMKQTRNAKRATERGMFLSSNSMQEGYPPRSADRAYASGLIHRQQAKSRSNTASYDPLFVRRSKGIT